MLSILFLPGYVPVMPAGKNKAHPVVYILGGQPGSGKTELIFEARRIHKRIIVVVYYEHSQFTISVPTIMTLKLSAF